MITYVYICNKSIHGQSAREKLLLCYRDIIVTQETQSERILNLYALVHNGLIFTPMYERNFFF